MSSAKSPVRSMTGYAAIEGTLPDGTAFTLSLKSVNHRFLDLHLRLPGGCDAIEGELRRLIKEQIGRGHVELTLELGRSATATVQINQALAESMVGELRKAGALLSLTGEFSISDLLRLPGVVGAGETRPGRLGSEEAAEAVLRALPAALERLNAAREREGDVLAAELRSELGRVRAASEEVSQRRSGVRSAQFDRLRSRLAELLAGVPVSEERLLTEAALLADKSDVEEETVRLRAHLDRFSEILEEGGAVGKRLDFLLQELNREANTTLAKTGSAAGPESLRLTELGLQMKAEIERAREQVQNLE